MPRIVCIWCQTVNDTTARHCVACGGPIEESIKNRLTSENKVQPLPVVRRDTTTQDLKKAGEETEKVYNAALTVYSLVWRTAAEALAIALAALLVGLAGGGTHLSWLGILGGIGLGVAVGLVQKNFWFVLLGAPLGVLAGALVGMLPWAIGFGPGGMVLTAIVLGIAGAIIGNRRVYHPGVYDRLRPFLGALGGLAFASLGALMGSGLAWLVDSISAFLRGS